jgi:tetratricopeptide (TPR) repeat protein
MVARRAIAIDSTLADGYRTIGGTFFLRGRNAEATQWFERALAHNPGLQSAMANLAQTSLFTGEWDQAVRWAKRAFKLDPTSPQMRELLANSYQDLREFEIANRWLQEALDRDPRSPIVRRQEQAFAILRGEPELGYRTFSDWLEGSGEDGPQVSTVAATGAHYAREYDDVLAWSEIALEQASGGTLRDYHDLRVIRAFALGREGLTQEAIELLASAERDYATPNRFGADSWLFPHYLSAIHLARGSREAGLEWFARADVAGFNGWNLVEQDPIFDVVRDDPRYRETIATMRGRLEAQRMAIEAEERAAGERSRSSRR